VVGLVIIQLGPLAQHGEIIFAGEAGLLRVPADGRPAEEGGGGAVAVGSQGGAHGTGSDGRREPGILELVGVRGGEVARRRGAGQLLALLGLLREAAHPQHLGRLQEGGEAALVHVHLAVVDELDERVQVGERHVLQHDHRVRAWSALQQRKTRPYDATALAINFSLRLSSTAHLIACFDATLSLLTRLGQARKCANWIQHKFNASFSCLQIV